MGTNRNKRTRKRGFIIDETVIEFFLSGHAEPGTAGHKLQVGRFFGDTRINEIWAQYGPGIVKKWRSQGIKKESFIEKWLRHRANPYLFYLSEKGKGVSKGYR